MYEWLDDEIARVKTPKFHCVDGPASAQLRSEVESTDMPLPPSYRSFLRRYGSAKLYRRSNYWHVRVLGWPPKLDDKDGEVLLHIGGTETSRASFKRSLLTFDGESPVFESYYRVPLRLSAPSFDAWLQAKCKRARRHYTAKEWRALESGPRPFSAHEQAIVDARRLFMWRVVGIAPDGRIRIEVRNGSTRTLPFLSLGIRGHSISGAMLNGGAFLPVGMILPGTTAVVEQECYKDYLDPSAVEVFDLPDPGPEDREEYWEFR